LHVFCGLAAADGGKHAVFDAEKVTLKNKA
jgi:hypothetical protein